MIFLLLCRMYFYSKTMYNLCHAPELLYLGFRQIGLEYFAFANLAQPSISDKQFEQCGAHVTSIGNIFNFSLFSWCNKIKAFYKRFTRITNRQLLPASLTIFLPLQVILCFLLHNQLLMDTLTSLLNATMVLLSWLADKKHAL